MAQGDAALSTQHPLPLFSFFIRCNHHPRCYSPRRHRILRNCCRRSRHHRCLHIRCHSYCRILLNHRNHYNHHRCCNQRIRCHNNRKTRCHSNQRIRCLCNMKIRSCCNQRIRCHCSRNNRCNHCHPYHCKCLFRCLTAYRQSRHR